MNWKQDLGFMVEVSLFFLSGLIFLYSYILSILIFEIGLFVAIKVGESLKRK